MGQRNSYIFSWIAHQKRRGLRSFAVALIGFLVVGLIILPLPAARAESVLEIPSQNSSGSASTGDDYSSPEPDPAPPRRHSRADDTPPAGIGSINDYMQQDSGYAQSGGSAMGPAAGGGYAYSSYGSAPEPNQNQDNMTAALIVGGIAVGLFALDALSQAHQHHHHR